MEIITFYLAGLIIAFIIIFWINKTSEEIGLGTLLKFKKRDCLLSWVSVLYQRHYRDSDKSAELG